MIGMSKREVLELNSSSAIARAEETETSAVEWRETLVSGKGVDKSYRRSRTGRNEKIGRKGVAVASSQIQRARCLEGRG